jgi:hypothetical protein
MDKDTQWIQDITGKHLTDEEYEELQGLEYILVHGYTDDFESDEKRYKELLERKWETMMGNG